METSKVTKTDLTGRLNEAAAAERPNALRPSDVVTPWPPIAPRSHSQRSSCYNNLLLLLVTVEAPGQSDVSEYWRTRREKSLLAA